jgi:hypothetical protein
MARFGFWGVLIVLILSSLGWPLTAAADEPNTEVLPPPRQTAPPVVMPAEPFSYPVYYRTSRYAVWQSYGVDRTGHFRPRVVDTPHGAYYYSDGRPYPWVTTHSRDYSLYVIE